MNEKWKPIPFDYLDKQKPRYYLSSQGRVKAYTRKSSGKILACALIKGYKSFGVVIRHENGKSERKIFFVHNLVARYFVPNPKKYKNVIHVDWDKLNNSFKNLRWGSKSFSHSKIPPEAIAFIKDLLLRDIPFYVIGKYFSISLSSISKINNGKMYPDVKPNFPLREYKTPKYKPRKRKKSKFLMAN